MTRTCIVTGGGTGLGRAIATRLATGDDDVIVVGRRPGPLAETAAAINAAVGAERVRAEVADLEDPVAVEALAARLPERVDVLVLNAGGGGPGGGDSLAEVAQSWRAVFDLNVLTSVLITTALKDRLPDRDGRVVAISSVAALRGAGAYGAAKGAIDTWVTGLAAELAPRGVTVNAVAPGFVPDTEFWEGRRTDELVARKIAEIPIGRSGEPSEVAALVAHLASVEAGFTTGQVVGTHGGVVLARL